MKSKLTDLRVRFEEMVARVETLEKERSGYKDFHARRLVETAGHIIITYLLARQAGESANTSIPRGSIVNWQKAKSPKPTIT